jgi:hypothetical protein
VAELEKLVVPFLVSALTFIAFLVAFSWVVEHVLTISEKSKSTLVWIVSVTALLVWVGAAAYMVHTKCEDTSAWDFLEVISDQ